MREGSMRTAVREKPTHEAPNHASAEAVARQSLREAIEKRSSAVEALAEAVKANTTALGRAREIEDQILALERRRERQADALVAALLDGNAGLADLGESEKKGLRDEAEALRAARGRLDREVLPQRRSRVQFAEAEVREKAKAVIAASGALATFSPVSMRSRLRSSGGGWPWSPCSGPCRQAEPLKPTRRGSGCSKTQHCRRR